MLGYGGGLQVGRITHAIDADAAGQQVSAWLRAGATAAAMAGDVDHQTPEGAMDGKPVRDTRPPGHRTVCPG